MNANFKEQKKQFTKDLNKFSNEALKFFRKNRKELDKKNLDTLIKDEFYNDICKYENGEDVTDKALKEAYFSLSSYTRFCFKNSFREKEYEKMLLNLEVIKDTKLYPYAKELMEIQYPIAKELLQREKEIEKIGDYLGKRNALEKSIISFKNKENEKALANFLKSLENWKESEIDYSDMSLIINGKNCGKEAYCGVKIGTGNKIHFMQVAVCFDEERKEHFIGCHNDTQWKNSDLIVIDTFDAIPDEVKAYFKEDKNSDEAENTTKFKCVVTSSRYIF